MQRHRNDDIGFIEKRPPSTIEPARESRREIEPVGMLERQDRASALFIVAHDRTRPVEGWRIGETGRAKRIAARVQIERQATALASRPIQEVDVLPACGAEISGLAHLRAATDTEWRVKKIEHLAPDWSNTAFRYGPHTA